MFTHLKSRLSLGCSLIGDLLAKYDPKNRQIITRSLLRAGREGEEKLQKDWTKCGRKKEEIEETDEER